MWSYFHRITVMTIPGVNHIALSANFKACGLTNYQIREFTPATKTTNDGTNVSIGDILAHNHCDETCANIYKNGVTLIEEAYNDGLENVLIFEDDAIFDTPFDKEKLSRMVNWLSSHQWDLFYFGQCPWPIPLAIPVNRDIVKTFNPLTAHAYAMSRNGMGKFLQFIKGKQPFHFDKLLRDSPLQKYASFPSICFQSRDPGLYRKAQETLPIPFGFRTISTFLEWLSVVIPILIIIVIILTIYRQIR